MAKDQIGGIQLGVVAAAAQWPPNPCSICLFDQQCAEQAPRSMA
jgi:hypothetical protein